MHCYSPLHANAVEWAESGGVRTGEYGCGISMSMKVSEDGKDSSILIFLYLQLSSLRNVFLSFSLFFHPILFHPIHLASLHSQKNGSCSHMGISSVRSWRQSQSESHTVHMGHCISLATRITRTKTMTSSETICFRNLSEQGS